MTDIIYCGLVATKAQVKYITSLDLDALPPNIDEAYNELSKIVPFGMIAIKMKNEIQLINAKHEALVKIIFPSWPLKKNTANTSNSASLMNAS